MFQHLAQTVFMLVPIGLKGYIKPSVSRPRAKNASR